MAQVSISNVIYEIASEGNCNEVLEFFLENMFDPKNGEPTAVELKVDRSNPEVRSFYEGTIKGE